MTGAELPLEVVKVCVTVALETNHTGCQDIAAPVAGVIMRACIRSAPRAVEWEGTATGAQWTVSRPSGLRRA